MSAKSPLNIMVPSTQEEKMGAVDMLAHQQQLENEGNPSEGVHYQADDFETIRPLGSGNFSTVALCRHKPTGELYAVKTVKLDSEGDAVDKELDVLMSVPHRNVVKYFGCYCTGSMIHLLLEFMDAGALDSVTKICPDGLPEPVIAAAAAQLLVALQDLHGRSQKFIHRDIKPSNILVNRRGEVKLSDFNTSRQIMNSMDRGNTFVGTMTYMSPERIRGESHDTSSDIWSLGLSLFEVATGRYPYPTADGMQGFFRVMDNVVRCDAPRLDRTRFSSEFCDFIEACLQKDQSKRKSARELLSLPFVTNAPSCEWLADWLDKHLPPVE